MVSPPIQIADADWLEVQRVLHQLVPELEVWAFGSHARHTAKPYSDLDLALVGSHALTLAQMASIADAFDSSDLPFRVDVLDWTGTNDAFRQIIAQDKVVIQAAKVP